METFKNLIKKIKAKRNTPSAILKMIHDLSVIAQIKHKFPNAQPVCIDIPESTFWNAYEAKITGERRVVGYIEERGLYLFPMIYQDYQFLTEMEIERRLQYYHGTEKVSNLHSIKSL